LGERLRWLRVGEGWKRRDLLIYGRGEGQEERRAGSVSCFVVEGDHAAVLHFTFTQIERSLGCSTLDGGDVKAPSSAEKQ
jgi:hypothetical protein